MSLYERNGIWWIYLVAPNGKKVRRTSELSDKQEAQKIHDLLKAQLIKAPQSVLIGNHTWQEASNRWLSESKHKATLDKDKMVLSWFGKQICPYKLHYRLLYVKQQQQFTNCVRCFNESRVFVLPNI